MGDLEKPAFRQRKGHCPSRLGNWRHGEAIMGRVSLSGEGSCWEWGPGKVPLER